MPDQPLPRFYVYYPFDGNAASAGNGSMVAFAAPLSAAVDAAHAAGLESGGTDDGAPRSERPLRSGILCGLPA